ncbi:hypothetical protein [Flammeovirga aprica]|uniref:Uncharacterized protein n=1 Tax=Flammeovirga aprica JL-4 TaxID=694437 RepID=A0A7X9S1C2_9BACT|nr:hypothetical protein [Flammeovirga aprica]NME72544.1 hypothetical protein [Flammeovirga aprica JL-4]
MPGFDGEPIELNPTYPIEVQYWELSGSFNNWVEYSNHTYYDYTEYADSIVYQFYIDNTEYNSSDMSFKFRNGGSWGSDSMGMGYSSPTYLNPNTEYDLYYDGAANNIAMEYVSYVNVTLIQTKHGYSMRWNHTTKVEEPFNPIEGTNVEIVEEIAFTDKGKDLYTKYNPNLTAHDAVLSAAEFVTTQTHMEGNIEVWFEYEEISGSYKIVAGGEYGDGFALINTWNGAYDIYRFSTFEELEYMLLPTLKNGKLLNQDTEYVKGSFNSHFIMWEKGSM